MKNLTLITLALFSFAKAIAADIMAVNNGTWSDPATWSTNGLPSAGDVVSIPSGTTVTINDVQQYNSSSMVINIFGTLKLVSPGKIDLAATSVITVFTGGKITGNGSPSETIKIGGTKKFDGTQADITGLKLANAASGTGFIAFGVLPVKFISFTVIKNNSDYQVSWTTAEEQGSDYYLVERSADGISWKTVARIAAAGNSSTEKSYSYTDKNANLYTLHYRVKQVDQDGKFTYTTIKSFKNQAVAGVKVIPSHNQLTLRFAHAIRGMVEVQVISVNGQVQSRQVVTDARGDVVLATGSLKGICVVTVRGSGLNLAEKLVF